MSSPFAIAAVTAVLKDLLNDGLNNQDLSAGVGSVVVTALPPDRITTGDNEASQLNLFMYNVTPNPGWRNVGLPSRNASGERLTNPPLALDLHYLLTAYGAQEFHAEVLLGYAMQLLHEIPVLSRAAINRTLKPVLPPGVSLPPGLQMLTTSDLAEQVELIKICPEFLSSEEASKLWPAMQAKLRPTAAYQVSVVLIEANKATRRALPVLTQGPDDQGPTARGDVIIPFPTIEALQWVDPGTGRLLKPEQRASFQLGDRVAIVGHHFAGDDGIAAGVEARLRLISLRLTAPLERLIPLADRDDGQIMFTLAPNPPGEPALLPAGPYMLTVQTAPPGDFDKARSTNAVPLLLAPRITAGLATPVVLSDVQDGLGTATIDLTVAPAVLPDQRVSLVLGSAEILASPRTGTSNALTFVATRLAAGTYRVRLRVDGVESSLVDRTDEKRPRFDDTQQIIVV